MICFSEKVLSLSYTTKGGQNVTPNCIFHCVSPQSCHVSLCVLPLAGGCHLGLLHLKLHLKKEGVFSWTDALQSVIIQFNRGCTAPREHPCCFLEIKKIFKLSFYLNFTRLNFTVKSEHEDLLWFENTIECHYNMHS